VKNIFLFLSLSFLALIFTACSSSDDSTEKLDSTTVTGKFIDDPVSGLSYKCSSGSTGVTDINGTYTCDEGDDVTFYLNSIELGTVAAQTTAITPYSLTPNDYTAALNLARLLQTLDTKESNGSIVIDTSLSSLVPNDVNFSSPSFETYVESSLGDITLVSTT
jgi:hypothetical protein